jgi:hypothetical protein
MIAARSMKYVVLAKFLPHYTQACAKAVNTRKI